MGKLIVVSNRLPVRINSHGEAERTTGGLASAMEGATSEAEQWWVGWPGVSAAELEDSEKTRKSMRAEGLEPVFLTREEQDGFYEGYSNSTLWPVLHYMVERAQFSSDWWRIYQSVNRKFADHILSIAEDGDRIWIHDYHLMLTPSMVRAEGMDLRIGFFLHTPFCSSEIFRALPNRNEILSGLLGSDVIGFHTFGYLRHFRSSLLRVLGLESEMDSIRYEDRKIGIRVYPIGHNHEAFEQALHNPAFQASLAKIQEELDGQRMILNVERLDYTKGIPEKLSAMRRFLELYPETAKNVVFLLIAVPSRQGVSEYDELTEEVQREVGALNGEFGTFGHTVVQFLHRSFPMEELAAFYAHSEVCMVTPLRDGMNLVAKEYMDCQRREIRTRPGVLILSEFAGATHQLPQAIHINPHDSDEVANALHRALEMEDEERWQKIDQMRDGLIETDNRAWAKTFLTDLEEISHKPISSNMSNLKPLVQQIAESVRAGKSTGLFLDYDGTLREFVDVPDKATPDAELLTILRDFAKVEHLNVAIVSGRKPEFLSEHFGDLGLTLVGEHGYRWRAADSETWQLLNPHVNISWKESMLPQLAQAARLTPGTHIEEKQSALVFHYRKADPEFGHWRANSLLEELTHMAANLPVTVHHGNKIVEISSLQVSKGAAVDYFIGQWDCACALVAGDDQTDETMLSLRPSDVDFHSIKVGNGATQADLRTDIAGLRYFLEALHTQLT